MNEILWYVSRASGLVSLGLLTTSMVLGLLTARRRGVHHVSAPVRAALHRNISLLMVAFISAHVVTAIVETYVDIGWLSLLLPFTSGYEKLWVGLGTLALDLLIAITVTSIWRDRISNQKWKLVHGTSYAMWPIVFFHAVGTSTTDGTVLLVLSFSCLVAVVAATCWRLRGRNLDQQRRQLAAAQIWR
jgi:sulfoxide reductase heme-binding subunit YedZ